MFYHVIKQLKQVASVVFTAEDIKRCVWWIIKHHAAAMTAGLWKFIYHHQEKLKESDMPQATNVLGYAWYCLLDTLLPNAFFIKHDLIAKVGRLQEIHAD